MSKDDNILVTRQEGKPVVRPKVVRGCAFWASFIVLAVILGGIGSILFPVGTMVGIVGAWFIAVYAARENENVDALVQAAKETSAARAAAIAPDRIERLRLLEEMRERGTLTDEEFEAEKAKLLNG